VSTGACPEKHVAALLFVFSYPALSLARARYFLVTPDWLVAGSLEEFVTFWKQLVQQGSTDSSTFRGSSIFNCAKHPARLTNTACLLVVAHQQQWLSKISPKQLVAWLHHHLKSDQLQQTTAEQAQQLATDFIQPAIRAVQQCATGSTQQQEQASHALPGLFDSLHTMIRLGHVQPAVAQLPEVMWLQRQLLQHYELTVDPSVEDPLLSGPARVLLTVITVAAAQADVALLQSVLQACEPSGARSLMDEGLCSFLLNRALETAANGVPDDLKSTVERCQQGQDNSAGTSSSSSIAGQAAPGRAGSSKAAFVAAVLGIADSKKDTKNKPFLTKTALNALADMALLPDDAGSLMPMQQLLPEGQPLSLDFSRAIIEAALSRKPAAAAWAVCVLQAAEALHHLLQELSVQNLLALVAFLAVPEASRGIFQAASAATNSSASLLLLVTGAIMQRITNSPTDSSQELLGDVLQRVASWLLLAALPPRGDDRPSEAASLLPFSLLLEWLEQQGVSSSESSTADIVSGLLQHVIAQGSDCCCSRKQSKQLYAVLLRLQQQPAWRDLQLTDLSAAACDALIQQQREPWWYGTSADAVLRLWQHAGGSSSSSSSLELLRSLSQQSLIPVLAALVRRAKHKQAVDVAAALDEHWQQLAAGAGSRQHTSAASAVQAACLALGTSEAEAAQVSASVRVRQQRQQQQQQQPFHLLVELWSSQLEQQQRQTSNSSAESSLEEDSHDWAVSSQPRGSVLRVRGPPPDGAVVVPFLAALVDKPDATSAVHALHLLTKLSRGGNLVPDVLPPQLLEACMLLLCQAANSCKDQAAADFYWLPVRRLVQDCLAAATHLPAAVLAALVATAVKTCHSPSISPQLVLQLAPVYDVLQAVMQLVQQKDEAATALLVNCLLTSCTDGLLQPEQLLHEMNNEQLDLLVQCFCSSGSSIALAEQLLQLWMQHRASHVPRAAALAYVTACGLHGADLLPEHAAVVLGLMQQQQQQQPAAAAGRTVAPAAGTTTADDDRQDMATPLHVQQQNIKARTQLVARCCQQLCQSVDESASLTDPALEVGWIQQLNSPAAAVALFSCCLWSGSARADGPSLLLELYHRTRQAPGAAKPSLESLVLDLGLIAAGRAGDWRECEQTAAVLQMVS
jgi:hypothetical protein